MSIVIPVYNEQESLPELLRRTTAACKQLAYEYEIILVDDGSRDKSAQLLEDAAAEDRQQCGRGDPQSQTMASMRRSWPVSSSAGAMW